MEDELSAKLEVDGILIKNAIRLQLPLEITTYTLPRNIEIYIRKILEYFLKECRQEHMYEYLNFCLGELLTNAKKANTKRVYFKEKNLDITNPDDYDKGMENFKNDTLTNIDHYLELQKKEGLYIKLSLQIRGEQIHVEIRNNAKITVFEQERINKKIDSVQQYRSMEEVFLNVLDQSEGAGLGIIIIILMLQKIGLSKENYQVIATDDETITKIILPCNQKVFAGNEILTYEFVKMQDSIPLIKENFEQITSIISKETINRSKVLECIQKDATLAMLLLKNTVKENPNEFDLKKALELLSDNQLREIFSSNNIEVLLVDNNPDNQLLWKHSQNVAFTAYNLVKNVPNFQDIFSPEQAYTLGLVNQIGYILLKNATKDQLNYIAELSSQFEDAEKINDIFFSGNVSPHISMILGKKIGFPDSYSAILGFWNNCDYIPENLRKASYIIYVAEFLQFYKEKQINYYQIDKSILANFNIMNEQQLRKIVSQLDEFQN